MVTEEQYKFVMEKKEELTPIIEKSEELERQMKMTSDPKLLKALLLEWRELQFDYQDVMGYPRDTNYHKEYLLPGCTCAEMDNNELYGTEHRYISQDCPYHGWEDKE